MKYLNTFIISVCTSYFVYFNISKITPQTSCLTKIIGPKNITKSTDGRVTKYQRQSCHWQLRNLTHERTLKSANWLLEYTGTRSNLTLILSFWLTASWFLFHKMTPHFILLLISLILSRLFLLLIVFGWLCYITFPRPIL